MKRIPVFIIGVIALHLNCSIFAADTALLASQILDEKKPAAEREAVIANSPGQSAELVTAMVKDMEPGTPEEYQRIPWIWRAAIAAGKRNDTGELRKLLAVALPRGEEPLRDWQAVVIGGGIINGLSLQNFWPGERITELLKTDSDLAARWNRMYDLAAKMADNEKVKTGTRYDALRIIALDSWDKNGKQLLKYLPAGVNAELQQGAISGLSDVKRPEVAPALLAEIEHFTPRNKGFAFDALIRTEERMVVAVDAISAGQISVKDFGDKRIEAIKSVKNSKLRAKLDKALVAATEATKAAERANVDLHSRVFMVGISSVDITPNYPVRLHGYLGRTNESEGTIQPLFAKALAIGSDKDGPSLLITVDNCMVPEHIREEVLRRLAKKKITSERFAIASSHTHSAPKLAGIADNIFGSDIPSAHQEHIERYTKELTDKLEEVALSALKYRAPALLSWAKTSAGFAANRRTKGGPVDHELPVLRITGTDGALRALLVNYACHCTTLAAQPNQMCGDWAGYAQEYLQQNHPGIIAMTAIGCGADANPSPRPGVENAKQHGREIAKSVDELLSKSFTSINGPLEGRTKRIILPLDTLPTREEWEQRAQKNDPPGYQARKNLARLNRGETLQTELPYLVQTWNFGDDLAMVFLPGEVVVDYSLRLKKEFDGKRLWVNAYANDVPCYIPSKRVLNEGGYEGGGAMVYYDRPARLGPNTEELIIGAVHDLMPKQFVSTNSEALAENPRPVPPTETFKTFKTKPGFIIDLAASEPQIVDPVAMDFGTDGRLWVVEMHDYPSGMDGNLKPGGRLKVLEDRDGDGFFEKSTLFLDELPFPTGLMQWRKGVLVCAAPDILYAEDTDNDGKADVVKKLFTGFATHNYQARINGLRWGLDNWVYGAAGLFGGKIKSELTGKEIDCSGRDIRFNPDTGDLEPVHGLSQQGRVRDDWGNWFGCDNSTFLWNFPMPDYYVRRNPHVSAPEPRVHGAKDADPNKLYPVSKTLERFNRPESANRTTSAAGVEIYRDNLLGDEFYGNAFTGETVHNLVHRLVLESDGVTVTGHRAEDEAQSEFLASTDNWFRPVEIRTGRDGALWIADMYRFVIEHPRWIPAERLAKLDVRAGDDKGRIFRIYPSGKNLRPVRDLTKMSAAKLAELLDTPNGPERDLIHRELYQRQDKNAAETLRKLASGSKSPAVRLQALCVLDGLKMLNPENVYNALVDVHPGVRRNAVRLSEDFMAGAKGRDRKRISDMWWNPVLPKIREQLLAMTADPDRGVRYQLALSLGEWNDIRVANGLAALTRNNVSDTWIRAALLTSAKTHSTDMLKAVMSLPPDTAGRNEMIGQLITTAAAEDIRVIESALVLIAPAKDEPIAAWQLAALATVHEALEKNKLTLAQLAQSPGVGMRDATARIEEAVKVAAKTAADPKASVDERDAAIRLLSASTTESDLLTLIGLAATEPNAKLQKTAMRSLRRQRDLRVPELVTSAWKSYMAAIRPELMDILLSRDEGIRAVLKATEQGQIALAEIPAASRQLLLKHSNEKIRARAEKLFPQNSNRKEVLAKFSTEVNKLTGQVEKGAEIFSQTCASCHAFRGIGHSVGPDLMPLGDKSVDDFLVAILDPNAVIEPRFIQYNIETKDDRSLSGVITAETATGFTLVQPGGAREKLLRSDVSQMKASSLSLMPEGLEEGRSAQNFADLIAYIKSRPATFGSATPEQAAEARKAFLNGPGNPLSRLVSASEKLDYPSWLGNLPLAHCRQTDGNSKVTWEGMALLGDVNPEQIYNFRFAVAMGFLSNPAGKFYLKLNGKPMLEFEVVLDDHVWQSKDNKFSMRYQVMESNAEDSNGVLTVSVKGELLQKGMPALFEVSGGAANSQRWFGVYLVEEQRVSKAQ